jgi:hypothetical protein
MKFIRKLWLVAAVACATLIAPIYAADLSQTAANVVGYGEQQQGRLGGTVTAGQPVRRQADGTWVASTNASAAGAQVDGIALSGGASGQPFTYQRSGLVNLGATVAVGMIYVLSASGAISPVSDAASGDYMTIICIATTTALCQMSIAVSGVAAAGDVT